MTRPAANRGPRLRMLQVNTTWAPWAWAPVCWQASAPDGTPALERALDGMPAPDGIQALERVQDGMQGPDGIQAWEPAPDGMQALDEIQAWRPAQDEMPALEWDARPAPDATQPQAQVGGPLPRPQFSTRIPGRHAAPTAEPGRGPVR
jgi:hypothetical protein